MTRSGIERAPHVLREYALLADGERGAVMGPHGDIAWLCVPCWDSPSIFSTLVGGTGCYLVTPIGRHVWGGYYEEGSMIWRNRWVTEGGIIESREALAFPGDPDRAVVLRRVHAVDTRAELDVALLPRGGYDTTRPGRLRRDGDVWTMRVGGLYLRWTGARSARPRENGHSLGFRLRLEPGREHDLVLEISSNPLPADVPDATALWQATEAAWKAEVPPMRHVLDPRDSRRSYAVMRGLTSGGGGMVAAATTSLPEHAEAGRNYDYRYVWIRDQCYAGQAAAATGGHGLLDAAVDFVAARLLDDGERLAPAYTTRGNRVPDQEHLKLPGYPGGYDIVGNWVNKQFQLDAFGEALQLFAAAAQLGRLDDSHRRAVQIAADAIAQRWTEPDAGIWELDDRAWTHSRLTAAGGLRAAAAESASGPAVGDWLALADRIVAETAKSALHPDGYWQRAPDDRGLDAALLLPGLRGAIPSDDPRTISTLDAYLRKLTVDGYAYRFRHDDRPLADAEGAFLLCGFLVALSEHQRGNPVDARAWYERTRAACGPAQLYSEEFDTDQHQMRGNLPQAFVHALHLETAARLAQ